jgi:hypothetical protein
MTVWSDGLDPDMVLTTANRELGTCREDANPRGKSSQIRSDFSGRIPDLT